MIRAAIAGHAGALPALARYLAVVVPANLVWEGAQLPLYAIWRDGTLGEILFAAAHCTVGDVMIATVSLAVSALALGGRHWLQDRRRFRLVAAATVLIALGYTAFSEWFNVSVRGSWAYSEWMPVVAGVGLSPLLQWVVLPALGFWRIRARPIEVTSATTTAGLDRCIRR